MTIRHMRGGSNRSFLNRQITDEVHLSGGRLFHQMDEAEPLATITSAKIINFYWRRIVCRFGVPRAIVSDNGTQFTSKQTMEFYDSVEIHMRFTSVEHPQSNGQVESANKVILMGIKLQLDGSKDRWINELLIVLWEYNTTPQSSTGETPFRLTYGTNSMLPVEIYNFSWRALAMDEGEKKYEFGSWI